MFKVKWAELGYEGGQYTCNRRAYQDKVRQKLISLLKRAHMMQVGTDEAGFELWQTQAIAPKRLRRQRSCERCGYIAGAA